MSDEVLMRFTDGMDTVDLAPAPGYESPKDKRQHNHISLDGTRYGYTWSRNEKHEIPVVGMLKVDADFINLWWDNNTSVDFYPDYLNDDQTFYSIDFVNEDRPLQMEEPFWANLYTGTIIVREV